MKNFAKIVESTNGNQVLFYVEPDGDDYHMHQIINLEGMQADFKITFAKKSPELNHQTAYKALESVTTKHADYVYKNLTDMLGK